MLSECWRCVCEHVFVRVCRVLNVLTKTKQKKPMVETACNTIMMMIMIFGTSFNQICGGGKHGAESEPGSGVRTASQGGCSGVRDIVMNQQLMQ